MGNKVKRIYVGTTKVRPPTWKPGANTVGYWELNGNGEDTKNDYGVQTYTSTDYDSTGYVGAGNPTYTTGRNGKQCAVFDGTRGLQLPGLPIPSNTLTISCWVNYTASEAGHFGTGASMFILRTDTTQYPSSWALMDRIKSDGTLQPFCVVTNYSSGDSGAAELQSNGSSLSTGVRHNVVVTFNAGTLKYYVDGTLKSTTSNARTYLRNNSTTPSYIGCSFESEYLGSSYISYLTGKIQDVIYENKVWTDQEVLDYYNNIKGTYGS